MFVFLHPLTLFILPTIICVYAVIDEEKRAKLQYNLSKTKILNVSNPIRHGPRHISSWNVEQRVEEYLDVLEKEKRRNPKSAD
jgi:hypothetical protein